MAENRIPKTNKDLAIALGVKDEGKLVNLLYNATEEDIKKAFENIKKLHDKEEDRLEIYEKLLKYTNELNKSLGASVKAADKFKSNSKQIVDLTEQELKNSVKGKDVLEKINKERMSSISLLEQVNRLLKQGVAYNQEMFRTAQEMQLQSNITWKEYRQLYRESYAAARAMNKEVGQQIHNSKELVKMQNQLLQSGYKDVDVTTLSKLSSSVTTMAKTIAGFGGSFPGELLEAFQLSYRQFGAQTDQFVTHLGNRLNAFSDTFGTSIGMLTGVVSQMMASNSFIARSNMQAQVQANESLMKAAALSGAVGLTSTNFISQLAGTAQFGTIGQMSSLFQGGALLKDFSTAEFQEQMIGMNYDAAIGGLFDSIQKTIGGIDDHYLRAEYMDRIGSTFGLSRDDLLKITTQGPELEKYRQELQEKLINVNTSMVDELKDYKMTWSDRIDNIFANSSLNETLGSVFNEFGLYGIDSKIDLTNNLLKAIAVKNFFPETAWGKFFGGGKGGGSGLLGNMFGPASSTSKTVIMGDGAPIMGLRQLYPVASKVGGVAVAGGGMMLGNKWGDSSTDLGISDSGAAWRRVGNVGTNIASGIAGGAMFGGPIGAAIGGGIGLATGLINASQAKQERLNSQRASELELRSGRRINNLQGQSASDMYAKTGDAIVDAIYETNSNLIDVLSDKFAEQIKAQFLIKTMDNTSAKIGS